MSDYPRRLIEVDLPIKKISAHARREKSIRQGHISTLHIWWARRPLAACRAVVCASLWPDPVDSLCPVKFREEACRVINTFAAKAVSDRQLSQGCSPDTWKKWQTLTRTGGLDYTNEAHWNILRFLLLDFIADFANFDNATVADYLETSRSLTQSAHESLGGIPGTRPLVVDPFAGGGAIPLEAIRIGADAFASDLNPVPVLLNKVLIEYIPRYGQRLASEVRKWGEWIKEEAEKELCQFYPKDPDGSTPIAYLWARTIRCEGPGCGIEVPLLRSLWLGKKPHNSWALKIAPDAVSRTIGLTVLHNPQTSQVGQGNVKRGSATCSVCGYTTPASNVRIQLAMRRGGTDDARMTCVVMVRPDRRGRFYRIPNQQDLDGAARAKAALTLLTSADAAFILNEPTPAGGGKGAGRAFSQRIYGMDCFGDLFTPRQTLALSVLCQLTIRAGTMCRDESVPGLSDAVQELLAINVSKLADYNSALSTWLPQASQETVAHTFARPAISMVWDFAEAYPLADSSGGWKHSLGYMVQPLEAESRARHHSGQVVSAAAGRHPLPDESAAAFITDPPYYDAVPYADLSDFFIVWLKRALTGTLNAPYFASLAPKEEECVLDEVKGHDADYFHRTMREAFAEGRRICKPNGIGVVVFAHKSTGAWESLLQSMIDAGWVISGSWPIDTERANRLRAMDSAALASSVHIVCRPRELSQSSRSDSEVGDWRDVLAELPKRIHAWMPRLQQEGVVGADAIFACLGPALEIFSRHSRVEKASGDAVTLKEYLEYVWGAVSREALSMIFKDADTSGFEEDSRLTAMWLWTLSSAPLDGEESETDDGEDTEGDSGEKPVAVGTASGFTLEYDAARKIAQGLGAHLDVLANLVEIKGDTARLLPVAERTKALFGKEGTESPSAKRKKSAQLSLPGLLEELEQDNSGWTLQNAAKPGSTTLDRLHQAMILFAAGRGEGLRRFLVDDGVGKDQRFWSLAQSLCALYPSGTDERRWSEGVLARKKGLGL